MACHLQSLHLPVNVLHVVLALLQLLHEGLCLLQRYTGIRAIMLRLAQKITVRLGSIVLDLV